MAPHRRAAGRELRQEDVLTAADGGVGRTFEGERPCDCRAQDHIVAAIHCDSVTDVIVIAQVGSIALRPQVLAGGRILCQEDVAPGSIQ